LKRSQLEHILRASGSITAEREIVVIGSQALLGSLEELPGQLGRSMEADVYPLHRPDMAELIDGSIGEGSPFHQTFGYYAQGVGPETAALAPDWQTRCRTLETPATGGVSGLCLAPEDIAASKALANRPKDRKFLTELFALGLADVQETLRRIDASPSSDTLRAAARALVRGSSGL